MSVSGILMVRRGLHGPSVSDGKHNRPHANGVVHGSVCNWAAKRAARMQSIVDTYPTNSPHRNEILLDIVDPGFVPPPAPWLDAAKAKADRRDDLNRKRRDRSIHRQKIADRRRLRINLTLPPKVRATTA